MKFSQLIFLGCFSILSCSKDAGPNQLLLNGNIESGDLAIVTPSNWQSSNGAPTAVAFEWSKDFSVSPSHSLKIFSTGANPSSTVANWYQIVPADLPAGKKLTLTAKIKGVNLVNNSNFGTGVIINLSTGTSTNPALQNVTSQFKLTGSFDWTEYKVELTNTSHNTQAWVALIYAPNTTGAVYFDDISLTY